MMATMEKVNVEIKRGDVFLADLGEGVGSEMKNMRPVVVLQNNMGNRYSPTIIVAAISSQMHKAKKLPTHVLVSAEECGLDKDSFVMLEQIRTIDKKRLIHKVSEFNESKMKEVTLAMMISLGAEEPPRKNVERPAIKTVADPSSKPVNPIVTDAGRRESWTAQKGSNFVAPTKRKQA